MGLAAYCLLLYFLADLGVVLGYHRLLSHRSFRAPRALERFLVTLGIPAGTPVQWAGNHRRHHATADGPGDPHSPHLDGFWYAHVGWYIGSRNPAVCLLYALGGPLRLLFDGFHRPRSNREHEHLAPDVAADPYYRFISRPLPYLTICCAYVGIINVIPAILWGWAGLGASWATLAALYNVGDAVDSVCHLHGAAPWAIPGRARNGLAMGLLAMGDGWHANHHAFPRSARHGLLPGQPDLTWHLIRLLRGLGLARDVYVPGADEIRQRLAPGRP